MAETKASGWKLFKRRLAARYLAGKGFAPPGLCAVMIGLEGTPAENRELRRRVRAGLAGTDSLRLGRAPGRRWLETRFFLPYLRDELMDSDLLVDTLETATTWRNLERLYDAVRSAVLDQAKREGTAMVVYTHVSHLYGDGASLYFSLLGTQKPGDPLGQWHRIKDAANRAIRETGGAISHHHGVGMDHKQYLAWDEPERAMVVQIKEALDPKGLLNPGKLF
jgi:alkyldihydroxyacetonephosphate synthase